VILRRTLGAIPLLLGVASLVFLALSLAPGDPAALYIPRGASPEVIDQLRRTFGLDGPLVVRYFRWLGAFLRGDFGVSFHYSIPVRTQLLTVLPNTLLLAGTSLFLAFLIGSAVGVAQAVKQGKLTDSLLSVVTLFFYSMPSFWLGLMLILVFSVGAEALWGWPLSFPASGTVSPGADLLGPWERLVDRAHHLVLPCATLTLILAGGVARYVRASMLEALGQDYIRTARAKGLSEFRVILKHALRNALIPVVSLFGVYFPFLLSGTVLVEKVFGWPGMGQLMVDSIFRRDFPVVLAGTVIFGSTVVVGNLLADLLYGVVDPRIREGRGWAGERNE
jgi:peptide/nickel transport system permease protein